MTRARITLTPSMIYLYSKRTSSKPLTSITLLNKLVSVSFNCSYIFIDCRPLTIKVWSSTIKLIWLNILSNSSKAYYDCSVPYTSLYYLKSSYLTVRTAAPYLSKRFIRVVLVVSSTLSSILISRRLTNYFKTVSISSLRAVKVFICSAFN
jgi:hypothetical protein